jgi:hypothetical protein
MNRRFRLRYSLRTFFLLLTAANVYLGWQLQIVRSRQSWKRVLTGEGTFAVKREEFGSNEDPRLSHLILGHHRGGLARSKGPGMNAFVERFFHGGFYDVPAPGCSFYAV